eukprot:260417_1
MSQFPVDRIEDECYDKSNDTNLYETFWVGYKNSTWQSIQTVQHLDIYKSFINKHNHWTKGQKCLYHAHTGYIRSKQSLYQTVKGKRKYEWIEAIVIKCNQNKRILTINGTYITEENIAFGNKSIKPLNTDNNECKSHQIKKRKRTKWLKNGKGKKRRRLNECKINTDNKIVKHEIECNILNVYDDISDTNSEEAEILKAFRNRSNVNSDISDTDIEDMDILKRINCDTSDTSMHIKTELSVFDNTNQNHKYSINDIDKFLPPII